MTHTHAVPRRWWLLGLWFALQLFSSVGSPYPSEARSLARQHVKEIHQLISDVLDDDRVSLDELSRAHLAELSDHLQKVLDANVEVGDF